MSAATAERMARKEPASETQNDLPLTDETQAAVSVLADQCDLLQSEVSAQSTLSTELAAVPGAPPAEAAEVKPLAHVEDGGYIYAVDPDTGEYIQCVGVSGQDEKFHVLDQESAEWVLEKMRLADADIHGLEASKKAELEAVAAQWDRRIGNAKHRAQFLEYRFGRQIVQWVQRKLDGVKQRSQVFKGGTVKASSPQTGLTVLDEAKAIAWARLNVPAGVKVASLDIVDDPDLREQALTWLEAAPKSVLVTYGLVKKPITDYAKAYGNIVLPEDTLQLPKPAEKWKIDTGIKTDGTIHKEYLTEDLTAEKSQPE